MRADKMLFYIFIFLLPWQTRFIFTPEKTEFLSFSIYLAEIFLWLALAFWLTSVDLKKIRIPRVLIFLCFYVLVSISWSSDRVAAFRLWLFIFEGTMIYLYLKDQRKENPPQPSFFKGGGFPLCKRGIEGDFLFIFLFSLFIISLFGIWQFFNLGSPALKWLGLAAREAWNLGDIVVESGPSAGSGLGSGRWLRAYGPFPHPNIFGGYLAAGLIILFNLIKNVTQSVRSYRLCYHYFLAAVLFFALFLTFSRSAWLALASASIYFIFEFYKKTRYAKCSAAAEHFAKRDRRQILNFFIFLFFLAIALSIIFWPFVRTRMESSGRLEIKSNTERVASWRDGLAVWRENPIFGSGPGNFTIGRLAPYSQPAHNIFLMVLAELGLAGFTIYLFLWRGFWKNPAARPLLILFFIIGLFDHYLWTLWPGQMLFWFGAALTGLEKQDNL